MKQLLRPGVRRWVYRVSTAGLVVAGVYGVVDDEQAAAWLLLVAAVTAMADVNVSDE
ncbi:hypothetical protein [Cellulomonas sp. A375-1]|uniref:hypothetical protein n=1 Tax=Cellulomonas sp. A375-1 TaxID=1672219 RepID=UPI000AE5D8FA|nr:hypothetical protein [Cellulomonas sp. A375-1]